MYTKSAVFGVILFSATLHATTIISVTGPEAVGGAIGLISGFGYVETSWSQTATYSNVSMSVLFAQLGNIMTGTAYLTTAIGPGTTPADQIAAGNFTVPDNPSVWQTVLTVPTLGPGTYYLVIVPTGRPAGAGATGVGNWWTTLSPTIASDSGVTFLGGSSVYGGIAPYGPASDFPPFWIDTPQFTVTTGVPEPATGLLLLLSAALGGLLFGSKSRAIRECGRVARLRCDWRRRARQPDASLPCKLQRCGIR